MVKDHPDPSPAIDLTLPFLPGAGVTPMGISPKE